MYDGERKRALRTTRPLCFLKDDATVVGGTHLAQARHMATKSLANRVAALEARVGSTTIEAQFRDQAESIDRRFTEEFRQQAELIDRLFAQRFQEIDERWRPRFATMERAIGALQKDMVIVREGISILLKRRPQ